MKANSGTWPWKNVEEKMMWEEDIINENCGEKLLLIHKASHMSQKDLAKVLGVREYTISRLINKKSLPTEDFLNRLRALQVIGIAKFSKLSDAEKSKNAACHNQPPNWFQF